METIGVVGAGLMGSGIAANLAGAGYPVTVFSRKQPDTERVSGENSNDIVVTRNLDELFSFSEVLVTCLPDSPAVHEVTEKLLCCEQTPVKIVIDFTTAKPDSTQYLAGKLKQSGIAMLDCPMTGGPPQAREATMAIAVGGSREVFDTWKPLLECVSDKIFYAGEQGSGNLLKLLNNFLSVMNTCAASAVSAVAEKSGVDMKALYEFISCSGGNSRAFQKTMEKIMKDDFALTFALKLARKDMQYASELFNASGGFSLMDSTLVLMDGAVEQGYGDHDFASVYFSIRDTLSIR